VLMAVRSHVLVAASFGPYPVDERTYAEDLWPSVPSNSLVLIDRAYLQANVLVPLVTGATIALAHTREDDHEVDRPQTSGTRRHPRRDRGQ